jgi:hypothetical protein
MIEYDLPLYGDRVKGKYEGKEYILSLFPQDENGFKIDAAAEHFVFHIYKNVWYCKLCDKVLDNEGDGTDLSIDMLSHLKLSHNITP